MEEKLNMVLDLAKKNPIISGVLVMGLFLVVVGGVWLMKNSDPVEVEVIEAERSVNASSEVWVDVQGAVVNPGVYPLVGDARVKDALSAAGGLAEDADRGQVARYINLAAKVDDGVKIFVPKVGENVGVVGGDSGQVMGVAAAGRVNINTASVSELDKLWGVGPARAQQIIEGRPYSKIEEVAKIVPSNVYERIKSQLSLY